MSPSIVGLLAVRLAWQLRIVPYHERANSPVLAMRSGHSIFDAIRDEVLGKLNSYQPHHLVPVLRGFAVAGVKSERLFSEVVPVLESSLHQLDIENRCHLAWSYATLDMRARPLFRTLVEETKRAAHQYSPDQLATTMWSFARLGINDRGVYEALLNGLRRSSGFLDGQALANIAWAQAETGIRDRQLLENIADALVGRISEIHRRALPYAVWAYAYMDISAPRLFDAVLSQLNGHLGDLTPQGLMKFVWAFSRAELLNKEVLVEAAHYAYNRLDALHSGSLSSVVWAFANAGYRDDRLLGAIAERIAADVGTLNPQQFINVVWAFGNVGFRHEALFRELCRYLHREKDAIPAKLYATAVWSISMVHPEMLPGIATRRDLDRVGYDASGWIQLYNALLVAGVVSPSEVFPAYERSVQRLMVGRPNRFELDVERTVRDILADKSYSIEPQKVIGGVVTDWYVEVDGKKFVIECDGNRHHVLSGPDGGLAEGGERWRAPARDDVQDKVLRLFGVTPIHVLCSTFYESNGDVPALVSALRAAR